MGAEGTHVTAGLSAKFYVFFAPIIETESKVANPDNNDILHERFLS